MRDAILGCLFIAALSVGAILAPQEYLPAHGGWITSNIESEK